MNRVACGSSHSVAWVAPDLKPPVSHEPVLFAKSKDPLGFSMLGEFYYISKSYKINVFR